MAIGAVSAISRDPRGFPAASSRIAAGGAARRADEAGLSAAAVEPIPSLDRRAGSDPAREYDPGERSDPAGAAQSALRPADDPRRPEWLARIVDERAAEGRSIEDRGREKAEAAARDRKVDEAGRREPTAREIRERLEGLLGEKRRIERREAEGGGRRSAEAVRMLAALRSRDQAVRAHESAHIAAGGGYVKGGAVFSYQRGPDGANYAVGGEVGIDTSPVAGKPEETAAKMRVVRAAALAPSDPSAADLSVAGAAAAAEADAMAQLAAARSEEAARRYGLEARRGAEEREAAATRGEGASERVEGAPARDEGSASPETAIDMVA